MRKPLLICCLSLSTLLVASASHGDETARQFEVEVIVFAHLDAYDGGELWPVEDRGGVPQEGWDSPFQPEPMAPLAAAPEYRDDWQRLPDSGRKLTAVAEALRRSNHYRPLAHLHWRQAVQAPAAAQALDLAALLGGAADGQAGLRVEGSLRLSVARFLHLETDLRLIEGNRAYLRDGATPVYRLQQSRRMRSGELHYIDHPHLGVLALVTPYRAAD